ncbi:hypothetical protein V8F33_008499 [Rhypophila sp. PSN 637]
MKLFVTATAFLPVWANAYSIDPTICMSSPPIALEAGVSVVSATVSGELTRRCSAGLKFADPDFLPVVYDFDPAEPCLGRLLASFVLPAGAPNGSVCLTWQCAGSPASCSHGVISGGSGDLSIPTVNNGALECISDTVQTRVNLTTITSASSTVVRTVLDTVRVYTTSLLSDSSSASATRTAMSSPQVASTASSSNNSNVASTVQSAAPDSATASWQTSTTLQQTGKTSTLATQVTGQPDLFLNSSAARVLTPFLPSLIISTLTVMVTAPCTPTL